MSDPARRLPPALVALTPGELGSAGGGLHLVRGVSQWLAALERALQAGLPGVLVREPRLLDSDFHELLLQVAALTRATDAWLCVHDRAHLVEAVGAHGLHLGFRSLLPAEARACVDSSVGIGLSTHDGDPPERSSACDWRSFGPVFATASKEGILEPTGLELLSAEAARDTSSAAPVWALGGITPARAPEVLATGVKGLFVRGALLQARDPARATASFLRALEGASR